MTLRGAVLGDSDPQGGWARVLGVSDPQGSRPGGQGH